IYCGPSAGVGRSRGQIAPPARPMGWPGTSVNQCVLGQCGTMFIPDTLRSCMVEPDVSTYLQAPSSGQFTPKNILTVLCKSEGRGLESRNNEAA
ncbi:hypothetical protein L9F63_023634, partial [Diploptera punctata]